MSACAPHLVVVVELAVLLDLVGHLNDPAQRTAHAHSLRRAAAARLAGARTPLHTRPPLPPPTLLLSPLALPHTPPCASPAAQVQAHHGLEELRELKARAPHGAPQVQGASLPAPSLGAPRRQVLGARGVEAQGGLGWRGCGAGGGEGRSGGCECVPLWLRAAAAAAAGWAGTHAPQPAQGSSSLLLEVIKQQNSLLGTPHLQQPRFPHERGSHALGRAVVHGQHLRQQRVALVQHLRAQKKKNMASKSV